MRAFIETLKVGLLVFFFTFVCHALFKKDNMAAARGQIPNRFWPHSSAALLYIPTWG